MKKNTKKNKDFIIIKLIYSKNYIIKISLEVIYKKEKL